MTLPTLCIERPVMTTLLTMAALLEAWSANIILATI
jgi:hypothetical protein